MAGIFQNAMDFLSKANPLTSLLGDVAGFLLQGTAGRTTYEQNKKLQDSQNRFNADQATLQRNWSSNEAQLARQWQEDFYNQYQSPEAMVRQYEQAGLNPVLATGISPSTPPSSGAPSGASAQGTTPPYTDVSGVMAQVAQIMKIKAEIENINADTANKNADTAGKDIENEFKPKLLEQNLKKGEVDIQNLQAGIKLVEAKTDTERDQLLNNAVQRRLNEVSADKVVEDMNKTILEQATERLKQKNISVSTEKLAQESLLIQYEQSLTALQSTLTRFSINEVNQKISNIAVDTLLKQWQLDYRNTFHMEPSGSAAGVFQQLLNAIATEGANLIQKIF